MPTKATAPHLDLSLQRALNASEKEIAPDKPAIRRWARAALRQNAEVTVRLVGEEEGRQLNRDYRGKDYATNVLTFVYDEEMVPPPDAEVGPLSGDLVLCVPVVANEAAAQGKALEAHFAHLIVHGMLHLQGFDHEDVEEAEEMEALEKDILETLGYADPYA